MTSSTAATFVYVFLGVETPEPDILRTAGNYQNLRNPLEDSLATINANGLNLIASFIIGFDGENSGAVDRIPDFVEYRHPCRHDEYPAATPQYQA